MTTGRWEPYGSVFALQNRINRLFEDAFVGLQGSPGEMVRYAWKPAVDIFDTDNTIILAMDLPGVSKDDVSLEVKDNLLLIQGERRGSGNAEESSYRRERPIGPFHRSFTLPATLDPSRIQASFKDGVLTLQIPKPEEEMPKRIEIRVEE